MPASKKKSTKRKSNSFRLFLVSALLLISAFFLYTFAANKTGMVVSKRGEVGKIATAITNGLQSFTLNRGDCAIGSHTYKSSSFSCTNGMSSFGMIDSKNSFSIIPKAEAAMTCVSGATLLSGAETWCENQSSTPTPSSGGGGSTPTPTTAIGGAVSPTSNPTPTSAVNTQCNLQATGLYVQCFRSPCSSYGFSEYTSGTPSCKAIGYNNCCKTR